MAKLTGRALAKRFDLNKTSGRLYRWALHTLTPRKGVRFNMKEWFSTIKPRKGVHGVCGTAACAAGHLALDRAFRSLGVRRSGTARSAIFNYWSSRGVADILGITREEAEHITMPSEYGREDGTTRGEVKKRAVKARILALAEQYAARGQ